MSGPIIRKYGFPNFDEIFGKRELEHGVDDKEKDASTKAESPASTETKPKVDDPSKSAK